MSADTIAPAAPRAAGTDVVLGVTNLAVHYPGRRRAPFGRAQAPVKAVDDVSFALHRGETLALVGESGSGKTTIGNAVLGLVPTAGGSVTLSGHDITRASAAERRRLAADLQVIFQNPYGSLNPSLTVGSILAEPLQFGGRMSAGESRGVIRGLLEQVGMPADAVDRYPGAFSGGQRQRIAIARAIALRPKVIVCDEPTSALDVSTQHTVLELLTTLQRETGVSYLFITHDLAVVRHFADRVAVLNRGRIVETGAAAEVCEHPTDPYTQKLVQAAPVPDPVLQRARREARLAAATTVASAAPQGERATW